jgi:tRNA G10  N-methylase Trm11
MQIAILGRLPHLGIAELERVAGTDNVSWFSDHTALIKNAHPLSVERLGGSVKLGQVTLQLPKGEWPQVSNAIINHYQKEWAAASGKLTIGLSAYGFAISTREVQKPGIILKQKLKAANVSLRLIPNSEPALSSATSHHNKLGLSANKVELLIVRSKDGRVIVAESTGAQNITALARRDQGRPKRDAFVGMLPPKLAQIMINLAQPQLSQGNTQKLRLLDPFCGTGVLLQEAALLGYDIYGTDLSEKMIDYSQTNLGWLARTHHIKSTVTLHQGDAMSTTWQPPIDVVACETYLGQPFSAPPSPAKLAEVRRNCDHIISSFLKNIAHQLAPSTPLCLAIPAWRDANSTFTQLRIVENLEELGYQQVIFNIAPRDLFYYREDQVVARQLLVLAKS